MTFVLLFLAQLADIKKLLTHSVRHFIIAGGLIFIERRDI